MYHKVYDKLISDDDRIRVGDFFHIIKKRTPYGKVVAPDRKKIYEFMERLYRDGTPFLVTDSVDTIVRQKARRNVLEQKETMSLSVEEVANSIFLVHIREQEIVDKVKKALEVMKSDEDDSSPVM